MYFTSLLPLLLISINYLQCEAGPLEYVSHPRTFDGARKYCRIVYGTELASIQNELCKNDATTQINEGGGESAWFGLYSNSESGNWRFLNGDECTADSAYKCIDLWSFQLKETTANRPRCIGDDEGGSQCAIFDVNTGIDNNIPCETAKPFFCEPRASTPSYNPGEYVLIDGGEFGEFGFSFETAQAQCQNKYGTDLATVITEDDAIAAAALIPATWPWAIIGLHDTGVEGQYEWIDGTPCTIDNGRCTDLFDSVYGSFLQAPDNVGDIDGESNADCIALNTLQLENEYYQLDGSNFFEMSCDNPGGIEWSVLCNAPKIPSYNPGNYVLIDGGAFEEFGFSFEGAQARCESEYGTDLATVITEADRDAVNELIDAGTVANGYPYAIIGLNDIDDEGNYKWIDGTPCTTNDGRCTDLFDDVGGAFLAGNPDDIADISGVVGADCIALNTYELENAYYELDGSNFFEMDCENTAGNEFNILCNAPVKVPSYNPGNYVLIDGGSFREFGYSFDEAQAQCESLYGTDLATVITEADRDAANALIGAATVANGYPYAIIGLNDIDNEGDYKWIDGTECTTNDGRCTDLFDDVGGAFLPGTLDDIGDIDSVVGADCIALNTYELENAYYELDGSNFFELDCENTVGNQYNILCNAPVATI